MSDSVAYISYFPVKHSMKTWHWQVQVSGDLIDLKFLERHFGGTAVRVFSTDGQGGFLIESEAFVGLVEPCDVKARADELIQFFAGYLQIECRIAGQFRTGGVYQKHDDGRQDATVFVQGVQARAEVGVLSVHGRDQWANLVKVEPKRSPALLAVELALHDPAMAQALRLLGKAESSWVDLYRIYEVLEGDLGGQHKTQALDWISESDLKLFKRSANSVKAAGDAARHGRELTEPPLHPMTLCAARSFLREMVGDWIEHKLQAVATL